MSSTKDAWQEQQEMEAAHQAYEQQQAERMYEMADMRRKEIMESRP